MTEQEKQLLLQDLCARLPYGVISDRPSGNAKITEIRFDEEYNSFVCYSSNGFGGDISLEKPYLRSMSSLTKEERIEIGKVIQKDRINPSGEIKAEGSDNLLLCTVRQSANLMEWLNAHHFDYRGLIEKGLALEAPEDMYKYEKGGEK